jgi:hypothetical protein
MLQHYVTPLPLVLVGAIHIACLVAMVALLRAKPASFPGWRVVGPGGTHWFCFVGSWGFAALLTWVWLFVGSARRDADVQMTYALGLIFAFGAGAMISGFYMLSLRRKILRWRGKVIRWRAAGLDRVEDMGDFESWRRPLSGLFHLRFRDGTILKLDMYARNAEDLAVELSRRSGGRFEII